jgi:hypothetical protein
VFAEFTVRVVKPAHPKNAYWPILATLLPIEILVKLVFWNAESPILVTLFGIVIDVNLLQP